MAASVGLSRDPIADSGEISVDSNGLPQMATRKGTTPRHIALRRVPPACESNSWTVSRWVADGVLKKKCNSFGIVSTGYLYGFVLRSLHNHIQKIIITVSSNNIITSSLFNRMFSKL